MVKPKHQPRMKNNYNSDERWSNMQGHKCIDRKWPHTHSIYICIYLGKENVRCKCTRSFFIFWNIGHVFCSLSSWCKCIYRYLQKELSYPTLWRSKSLWKSISRRRWRSICSGTLKLTLSPRISWIFHPLVFTLKNLHNWTRGGNRRYFHGEGWTIVYTIGKGIMDKHRLEWFARHKKASRQFLPKQIAPSET